MGAPSPWPQTGAVRRAPCVWIEEHGVGLRQRKSTRVERKAPASKEEYGVGPRCKKSTVRYKSTAWIRVRVLTFLARRAAWIRALVRVLVVARRETNERLRALVLRLPRQKSGYAPASSPSSSPLPLPSPSPCPCARPPRPLRLLSPLRLFAASPLLALSLSLSRSL